MKIIPVILSGGAGTRLWPVSRLAYPKQFLSLTADGGTLFQETVRRVSDAELFHPPLIVCNTEHRFIIAEQLRVLGVQPCAILLEPVGRNTAPALAIAALYVQRMLGEDAVMLAMPSDHVMQAPEHFFAAVQQAKAQAQKGRLMTFGITPDCPETAYGYIRQGVALDEVTYEVAHFAEKPNKEAAQGYLNEGGYVWNSGIFLLSALEYLKELEKFQPEMVPVARAALEASYQDLDFTRLDVTAFSAMSSISIDHAVMERTSKAGVIPVDCGWSDLGSWDALWKVTPKDASGNVVLGNAYLEGTTNAYVCSQGVAVGVVGMDNVVVVSTPDAVLVADKNKAQDIKALVEAIGRADRSLVETQRRVYRPWGYYESVDAGERHQVKHLRVYPGEKLSLQLHRHRAEHWIVVKGRANITLDDQEYIRSENQSFYIPIGAKHRLENREGVDLDIIEVQSGAYLGEDDIERFDDKYNRKGS